MAKVSGFVVGNVLVVHLVGRVIAVVCVTHFAKEKLDAVEPIVHDQVGDVRQDLLVLVFAGVIRDKDQAPCRVLFVSGVTLDG